MTDRRPRARRVAVLLALALAPAHPAAPMAAAAGHTAAGSVTAGAGGV